MDDYEYYPGSFGAERQRLLREIRSHGIVGRFLAWRWERKFRRVVDRPRDAAVEGYIAGTWPPQQ